MRARASMCCSSAPSAASRRSCCRVNRSATASYRSSRSIAAPGGATRAGCGSRHTWGDVGRLLREERPAVVIGTGGYAAGPVVLRAQRAGIPTALVEENAVPGLTTRWLARGARQVHLGFPEARDQIGRASCRERVVV